MILRPASESDRETVKAISRQLHDLHVAYRPDIFRPAADFYNDKGIDMFLREGSVLVLEHQGTIAGFVHFSLREIQHRLLMPRKLLYIEELCVDENFRRQGLGRQMMRELMDFARSQGCTDMELTAYPQNEGAIRLYESLGFTVRHIDYQMKL